MKKESSGKSDSFKQVKKLIKTCVAHSNDLLNGAKLLFENGKGNIAYHLATLALEELGKSTMIVIGLRIPRKESELNILEKYSDDHIKKLFWALWFPSLGREQITAQQIRACQDLARKIHHKRLAGLYVDPNVSVRPGRAIPRNVKRVKP
jgi:AbiV family abortive infection protein